MTACATMPTTVPIMVDLIRRHPANAGRQTMALIRMAAWQAYKRTIRKPLIVSGCDGLFRIKAYPDNAEGGRFVYFGGMPDFTEMTLMQRTLRPGDVFVDGGAHIGTYSLLAASLVGASGAVHAFEGSPATTARLLENVRINGFTNLIVHAAALSNTRGTVSFVVDRGSGAGNRIKTDLDQKNATVQVAAVTIDDSVPEPFFMGKLDVEGAEPLVLTGSERHLETGSPAVWILEIQERYVAKFGWTEQRLVAWLRERSYSVARYDPNTNNLAVDIPLDNALMGNNALVVNTRRVDELERRLRSAQADMSA